MITFSEIKYPDTIRMMLQQDDLYKIINVKDSNKVNLYKPDLNTKNFYSIKKDDKTIGLFIVQRLKDNVVFHGGVYKKERNNTIKVLEEALKDIKLRFPGKKIVTTIPEDNTPAINIVKKAGLRQTTKLLFNNTNYLLFEVL